MRYKNPHLGEELDEVQKSSFRWRAWWGAYNDRFKKSLFRWKDWWDTKILIQVKNLGESQRSVKKILIQVKSSMRYKILIQVKSLRVPTTIGSKNPYSGDDLDDVQKSSFRWRARGADNGRFNWKNLTQLKSLRDADNDRSNSKKPHLGEEPDGVPTTIGCSVHFMKEIPLSHIPFCKFLFIYCR